VIYAVHKADAIESSKKQGLKPINIVVDSSGGMLCSKEDTASATRMVQLTCQYLSVL